MDEPDETRFSVDQIGEKGTGSSRGEIWQWLSEGKFGEQGRYLKKSYRIIMCNTIHLHIYSQEIRNSQ